MWKYNVIFNDLSQASEFINKINKIKNIEYHIFNNVEIQITSDNEYAQELMLETLAEFIVKTYKTAYLNSSLCLDFLPEGQKNALIKALTLFDIECDVYYVLLYIEKYNKIVLSSFDKFILQKLKCKWQEFVFITNLNNERLLNYEVFVEFLKFLLNSIQPHTKVVNLKTDFKKFLIFDEKNMLVADRVDLNDEVGLITNLVLLAPQNINIHCIDKMSNKTFKTLYYLFDKKINLLV